MVGKWLPEDPQECKEEQLGGEAVEHAGDRMVEGVVETTHGFEKCRFPEEEIVR